MSIRRVISVVAATTLVATSLVTGAVLGATAAPASIGGGGQTEFTPGRYIVTMVDQAAATYDGGVRGFDATTPPEGEQLDTRRQVVQDYTEYLEEKQDDVAASVGADIDYSYTLATNGFAADLTAAQAVELSANKLVASIVPDELKHITAAQRSTEFLGLEGEDGLWASIGGAETAGEGIVVGVLDTGFAPENPAFAGDALGSTPGAAPYVDGDSIVFEKSDGQTFTGVCTEGDQFTADDCSTKVISARYFVDGFGAGNLGDASVGEYVSPRDGDGHGSHTASTAAGNYEIDANVGGNALGYFSGVAPAAKIAAYKVCWSGPDPVDTTDDGCASTDLLAAIDQAVADGVDVINYSIGGGAASSTVSPTDQAFLGAAAAGVFVAASAGNSGPDASTLDNAAPWITTVAASTIPNYEATVTLGDGQEFAGASITVDLDPAAEPLTGELVYAADVALEGAVDPDLCLADTLDPALVDGKIVICDRGVIARVDKSAEVARAGGIGAVLVNVTPSSTDLDTHVIPTIHLDAQYRDAVLAYAATEGATATFTPGNETAYQPPTPQVAGFSSRGPVEADGSDIIKPDISAPGVGILAASANAEGAEPTFALLSGTSMSSPHVAGLAALYLGERPNATPAEIKSAFMTTAYDTVDGDGNPVTDPFTQGAGHIDPTKFFEPGLLYLNGIGDWLSYIEGAGYDVLDPAVEAIDPSNLNLASIGIGSLTAAETITRTVTSTQAGTFEASISVPGIDATVSPSTLTFGAAGETQSYEVTISRTDAPLDQFTTGALTWTSGDTVVHSPIAVRPVTILAPDTASGTGTYGAVDVTVTPGGNGDIPLTSTGLTAGVFYEDPTGTETEHSGSGVSGDEFEYAATVPEGTTYARFDLDSIDDTADLDLIVYLLDGSGTPIAGWQSATGAADERVNLADPTPGDYLVIASVYAANPSTAFDVRTFAVVPGAGEPLGLNPEVLPGVQGEAVSYTASWEGLAPFTNYLGLVSYGDTGATTAIEVVTQEDVVPGTPVNTVLPTISGKPLVGSKLTANPGEWDVDGLKFSYQWQANGENIAGADKRKYTVTKADEGKAITVVVTTSKKDLPSASATSEAVTINYSSSVSLSVSKHVAFSWNTVSASIRVATGEDAAATGTVKVTVDGKKVDTITLDEADNGKVTVKLPKLDRGLHQVKAEFTPAGDNVTGSSSRNDWVWIVF
ncbi:S8 family serine peptidase [Salinibacterium sp. NK8237]|uniref:S8 family serine peptidase n=1 Tax=Salinibacterium sp. NK8237 TaxID=2792038 RepID=UPI0018CF601A|nr:S8 family serine peptidase [Salinibacterium sp. NK8237]MBH0129837.1 S8 family serine peptidase [Salinibacterium sp. NK8237]